MIIDFRIAILFIFLVCYHVLARQSIEIPASFSRNHHAGSTIDSTLFTKNILKDILFKYELQSHIDIILVYDKKIDIIDDLNDILNQISQASIASANISITHESLLYHISISGTNIFNQLSSLESKRKDYSRYDVDQILAQDFNRRSSLNALYLIFSPIPASWQNKPCPNQFYKGYISSSLPFSWMYVYSDELSMMLSSIADNIVVYPKISSDKAMDPVAIAATIAKASEYLNPFPVNHRSFDPISTAYMRTVTLIVCHICYDELTTGDSSPCKVSGVKDKFINSIITELSSAYFAAGLKLIVSIKELVLGEYPDIAHAMLVSSTYDDGQVISLNSSKIAESLASSISWKNIISAFAETSAFIDTHPIDISIPLVSITSTRYRIVLDGDHSQASMVATMDTISDPWHLAKLLDGELSIDPIAKALSDNLIWPHKLILTVNNAKSTLMKRIECKDNSKLLYEVDDAVMIGRDIYSSIQQATCGIMPHHQYFSMLSNRVVKDISWGVSDSESSREFHITAYDKRAIARHIIIYRANDLIRRFVSLTDQLDGFYGVNITTWIESKIQSVSMTPTTSTSSKSTGYDLLVKFLKSMQDAAESYAHAEYKAVFVHISNAEVVVADAEKILLSFTLNRGLKIIGSTIDDDIEQATAGQKGEDSNQPGSIVAKKNGSMLASRLPAIVFIVVGIILGLSTNIDWKKQRSHSY